MIAKVKNFLKETAEELKKVSWSTRGELVGATVVVLASTAILAIFIGIIDLLLSSAINFAFR